MTVRTGRECVVRVRSARLCGATLDPVCHGTPCKWLFPAPFADLGPRSPVLPGFHEYGHGNPGRTNSFPHPSPVTLMLLHNPDDRCGDLVTSTRWINNRDRGRNVRPKVADSIGQRLSSQALRGHQMGLGCRRTEECPSRKHHLHGNR